MYLSISKIGNGDSIQTALNLVPIPPGKERGSAYGEKAVITITDPVCVDYHWVGDWEPTFSPPLHEHAARNTTISPANPSQQEVSTENVKLKFDGWYRLWNDGVDREEDGKKTWNYNGKKYVSYGSKLTKEVPAPAPSTAPYYFEGWMDGSDIFYTSRAIQTMTVKRDLNFVAHWAKNATVTFKIVNGYWSGETAEDRNVTVVLYPQADGSVGGTLPASSVPAIMIPAAGYENAAGSWDAAPNIEPNGIVDSVTYTYTFGQTHSGGSTSTKLTLHYESNGGTSYRDERYSSGTIVNLDKIPIRGGYTFSGWYADAGLTAPITNVRMTENKTVYAGWEATAVPDMLDGTGHWAEKSIERAAALGWIAGYADDTFRPNHYITRAEAMTMINRVLCRVPETEGDLLPGMITWPDNQPGT